jgi:RNA polymerase sigma factor (sigma-70 family)
VTLGAAPPSSVVIRSRADRWFARFRRSRDPRLLAKVFDHTAPELWRVAAHLCRDTHAAEDAVQATWLAAIEHADDWDAARPLMPWLLGVLANRVREHRRRALRAPDAARLVERSAQAPEDAAAHGELGAAFRGALERLAEPYRSVVRAHLVDGQAPHEIAAVRGVSAGAVRMQLHRGLDQLRKKLPAGYVSGAVVALRAPESLVHVRDEVLRQAAAGASPAAVGAGHTGFGFVVFLLMNKIALSCVAVAAAAVSLWFVWPVVASVPPAPAPAVHAPNVVAAASDRPVMPPGGGVFTSGVAARDRSLAAAVDAVSTSRLRVRLRKAGSGEPVVGLGLEGNAGMAAPLTPAAVGSAPEASLSAGGFFVGTTDEAGVAAWDVAPGFARVKARLLPVEWQVEVPVGGEAEIVGEVPVAIVAAVLVHDAAGRPVPGARIVGRTQFDVGDFVERALGTTDRSGRWRADFVERSVTVRALADGASASAAAELRPAKPKATLTLGGPPAVIEGIVSDVRGVAVPSAGVVVVPMQRRTFAPLVLHADERGWYSSPHVPPGPVTVIATREVGDGHRRFARQQADLQPGQRAVVDVSFGIGATVIAAFTAADGSSADDAELLVALREPELLHLHDLMHHVAADDHAQATIDAIMPGRYELQFAAGGQLVCQTVDLADGQVLRVGQTLGGREWLALRLVDEARQPLAGWIVHRSPPHDGLREEKSTDEQGRVRFDDLVVGEHRAEVRAEGASLPSLAVTLATGAEHEVVVRGASSPMGIVRGVVVRREEVRAAELSIGLLAGADRHDVVPHRYVTVDPTTGAFESPKVPPGTYHLFVSADRAPAALRMSIVVVGGETTDLGVVEAGLASLALDVRGDVGEFAASVRIGDRAAFAPWRWQERGEHLVLSPMVPGPSEVLVWGPRCAPVVVAVQAGFVVGPPVPVQLAAAAPVTFEFASPPRGMVELRVEFAGAPLVNVLVPTDLPVVRGLPPGDYVVECVSRAVPGTTEQVLGRATFTVVATAPMTVVLASAR